MHLKKRCLDKPLRVDHLVQHHMMLASNPQLGETIAMTFGERVRNLRNECEMTQRELAERLDVTISYVSKVENGRLHHGDFPSEKFILKLAHELDADEDKLLLLADKVPPKLRKRIREKPEAFRRLAELKDKEIDRIFELIAD